MKNGSTMKKKISEDKRIKIEHEKKPVQQSAMVDSRQGARNGRWYGKGRAGQVDRAMGKGRRQDEGG